MANEVNISPAREHLLEHAMDPLMSAELNDIINASPRAISRDIQFDDIAFLANFIDFPRNRNNSINIGAARNIIETLLINNPAFRSQNSAIVCRSMALSFFHHPLQPNSAPSSPSWAHGISISTNQPLPSLNEDD